MLIFKYKEFIINHNIKEFIFKNQKRVNCILDVSGSNYNLLPDYVEFFKFHNVKLNLIQIDTEIRHEILVSTKKELLSKFNLIGGGGTDIQPANDYISNHHLNKFNTIILTDGYTDSLDFSKIKTKTVILSSGILCNIKSDNNKIK